MNKSKTVDEYLAGKQKWTSVLNILREIILQTGLKEEIKWGSPVYTLNGKNVLGLAAFKFYCGLWFFQGALLKDNAKILISGTEGVTKAQRQLRIYSEKEIDKNLLKKYVEEAIENCRKGLEIKPEQKKDLFIPEELENEFEMNSELKERFGNLGLTKKREFAEYISEAKQEATKKRRIEKILPMIMNGTGLNDKYR